VVGHSYIVYAPLLVGCTTVMYEGKPVGTPDAGAFWRPIWRSQPRQFAATIAVDVRD
jgi:acyl-coenzyme A synthetase/AMP-(fatty) acid ligase